MALTDGSWELTTQVRIASAKVAAQGSASPNGLATPSYGPGSADRQTLTFGTTGGKADILCAVQNTLAATTAATYDLYLGTDLKDVYGGTAAIRTLRGICVVIESGGDAAGLRIGGAASNPNVLFFGNTNDLWTIFPSGPPFAGGSDAGVAVTNSAKALKVENLGAVAVTFTIYLAGRSV